MRDLIIIGSGPAGLAAAIYARRAALDTLVLDSSPVSGGQILNTYEVDNYLGLPEIGGYDLAVKFREHADRLGCEFAEAKVTALERTGTGEYIGKGLRSEPTGVAEAEVSGEGLASESADGAAAKMTGELQAAGKERPAEGFLLRTDKGDFTARSVIIASGASHARLMVPGEEEFTGAGVSYCATCDGAFFRKQTVAVVGGGDVAVEDAIFLARGCEKVYLIHRRDELRAAAVLRNALMALPNVEIIWDTVVEKIEGNGQVEGLRLKNVKSGELFTKEVAGVFIAVGIRPNSAAFREFISCDGQGYLVAGEDCATGVAGIFAAGDVRTKKLRQIVTAVADGACAVAGVQHYLLER